MSGSGADRLGMKSQKPIQNIWIFLVLLGLAIVPYVHSLDVPFVYDDDHSVVKNPHIRSLSNLGRFFVDPECFDAYPEYAMYRPMLLVTYAYNIAWFGLEPWVFHATNVLLHALATLLVYSCLVGLVRRFSPQVSSPSLLPMLGAVVFAVHPIHSEAVVYVSGRSDLLVSVFLFASFLAYLHSTQRSRLAERRMGTDLGSSAALALSFSQEESDSVHVSSRRRFGLFGLSLVFYALAMLTKATGIVVPASLIALEFLGRLGRGKGEESNLVDSDNAISGWEQRRIWPVVCRITPFLLLGIGFLFLRHLVLGDTGISLSADRFIDNGDVASGGERSIFSNLLTQTKCLVAYLGLFLWPSELSIEHYVEVSRSASDPSFLFALSLVVLVFLVVACFSRRRPLILFFFLWVLIGLAPTSSLIPLNVVMTERRMYVCGLGTAGILCEALLTLFRWRRGSSSVIGVRIGYAVLVALVVAAGWRTWERVSDWKDPIVLWRQACRVAPLSDRAHRNLGTSLAFAGDLEGATAEFRESVRLRPNYAISRINLGEALRRRGETTGDRSLLGDAADQFRWVLEQEPESRVALHKLAITLVVRSRLLGQSTEADDSLSEAIEIYGNLLELFPGDGVARTFLDLAVAERHRSRGSERAPEFDPAAEPR